MTIPTGFDNYATLFTNCVLYLDMNGDAKDVTNNNNDGTVIGATLTTDHLGNANRAYDFNGTSDYIGRSGTFASSDTTGSIAYWFKVVDDPAGVEAIISFGDASSASPYVGFGLQRDGYIRGDFNQPSASPGVARSLYEYQTDKADNTWHLVMLSQTGSGFKLHVDGSDVTGSTTWTSGAQTDTNWIGVQAGIDLFTVGGLRRSSNSQFYDGMVGEVFYFSSDKSDYGELLYDLTKSKYIYPYPKQVME